MKRKQASREKVSENINETWYFGLIDHLLNFNLRLIFYKFLQFIEDLSILY